MNPVGTALRLGRQEKLASLDKSLLVEILRYLADHHTINNAGGKF